MPVVYVSVGSNIDREKNIRSAIRQLKHLYPQLVLSTVYETAAEGFDGDPFYNLVVGFETDQEVEQINRGLRALEHSHGRVRGEVKFSSRTLDLDLLLYGQQVFDDKDIPRAEITRYAFVLLPLAEIAPAVVHPVTHKAMSVLWDEFKAAHKVTTKAIHPVDFSWE